MNFRLAPDMYVCIPKVQLAHYVDNTMPRRRWSDYDAPSWQRRPARRVSSEAPQTILRQAG